MTPQSDFFNEPSNLSGWQLIGKVFIGILVGGVIAALLFVILSFMGGIFTSAFGQQTGGNINPLLSLVLLFIGFLSTFIGNIAVGGIYNLFYNRKYYNTSKMFGLLFLTNGILFFFLAPIYIIFASQVDILFLILGFHILFSVFASASQIEFSTNPNYSASAFMGNILGFVLAFLMYCIIYKMSGSAAVQQKIYLFMLLPPILAYTLIPFGSGIREKIYYKFYELGNNGFYIPSSTDSEEDNAEQNEESSSEDDINVEN
ncbi:MAG: hypothetical protein WC010_02315 [Candidatus Absconditabacterales bacterium]